MKGSLSRKPRSISLTFQVMGLTVLCLFAAFVVQTAVALILPPPPLEMYQAAEVAQALKTPGVEVQSHIGHSLKAFVTDHYPAPSGWAGQMGRLECRMASDVAAALDVPDDQVVVDRRIDSNALTQRYNRSAWQAPSGGTPPGIQTVIRCSAFGPRAGTFIAPGIRPLEPMLTAPFLVGVKTAEHRWVVAKVMEFGPAADWRKRVLLAFVTSFLVLAPLAYLFAKGLAAPIIAFAEAARQLGRNPAAPPLAIEGPREVGVAAEAFNEMQEQIQKYVQDRTSMIAAVAHDLRTPLTRLRFRIEQAPEELQAKLAAELDEMEAMITAALAFVRDASQPAQRQKLDLSVLVETVAVEMAETGMDVQVAASQRVVIEGDALGLRRLVSNLIVNAVKFGERARVRVVYIDSVATLEVEDDGPGLAVADLERVFEPFVRLEPSRSRQTGGAGLGLATVRTLARAHGGDASLHNRAPHGLIARVTFPG